MKDGRLDEAEASFRECFGSRPDPDRLLAQAGEDSQEERGDFELCCAVWCPPPSRSPPAGGGLRDAGLHPQGAGCPMPNSGPCKGWSAIRRSHWTPAPCCALGSPRSWTIAGLFAEAASQLESPNALQSSGKAVRGLAFDHDKASRFLREDHRGVHARVPLPASRLGRPGSASGLRGRPASIRDDADGTDPRLARPRPRGRRAARGPQGSSNRCP